MTLVEFLSSLSNRSNKSKILAILLFNKQYKKTDALTIEEIRENLISARVSNRSKINYSDILAKCHHFVNFEMREIYDGTLLSPPKKYWMLTKSGEDYVKTLIKTPSVTPKIVNHTASLSAA